MDLFSLLLLLWACTGKPPEKSNADTATGVSPGPGAEVESQDSGTSSTTDSAAATSDGADTDDVDALDTQFLAVGYAAEPNLGGTRAQAYRTISTFKPRVGIVSTPPSVRLSPRVDQMTQVEPRGEQYGVDAHKVYRISSDGEGSDAPVAITEEMDAVSWLAGIAFDSLNSRLVVSAADAFQVKLYGYSFESASWSKLGELEAPGPAGLVHNPSTDTFYALSFPFFEGDIRILEFKADGELIGQNAIAPQIQVGYYQVSQVQLRLVGSKLILIVGPDTLSGDAQYHPADWRPQDEISIYDLDPHTGAMTLIKSNGVEDLQVHSPSVPTSSCDPASNYTNSDASGDVALHVVSVYQPTTSDITVTVTDSSMPVALLLSAYDAVNWHVVIEPGVTISRVYIEGAEDHTVDGVDASLVTDRGPLQSGYQVYETQWEIDPTGESNFVAFLLQLREWTGLKETSYQGCYEASAFSIPY